MSYDLSPLIHTFNAHRNAEKAQQMERYMRNQFPFFGIPAPERRQLVRDFTKTNGLPKADELHDVTTMLWNQPERECQIAALDLLQRARRVLNDQHIPLLEWMIVTKSWWDSVDTISPQSCGPLFQKYPDLIEQYAEKWIIDDNFWLRRAALLFQLKYKDATDEERLYRYILLNTDSNQFFIQKAIGWVLREYSKTAPDSVQQFIQHHDLKPLSKREGLKWLNSHST
ncbi:DNA alkylation repair protein [Sporolactobacillus kofuensis]|uniref:DNA alkylation repair protein n=1 Tax=Sporolactobacillus kofuensis TaxID=269672 RepID=A0ABW1WF79_9BACL|nr:DNA alkylation repair protein [Sporolactobacillus kofuensis]MCO7175005.1 DNA alkylation repair protein [Sporolactobacillus kofuensis]